MFCLRHCARLTHYEKQAFTSEAASYTETKKNKKKCCCSALRIRTERIGWAPIKPVVHTDRSADCLWVGSGSRALLLLLHLNERATHHGRAPLGSLLLSCSGADSGVAGLSASPLIGTLVRSRFTSHRRPRSCRVLGSAPRKFLFCRFGEGSVCGPRSPTEEEPGEGRAPGTTGKRNDNSGRAMFESLGSFGKLGKA